MPIIKKLRVNEGIKARECRLVGDQGEQLGVMALYQALEAAKKKGLDLVEVAPTAVPPVCRMMDYGKFKYEQAKKEREMRKTQKISIVREIRLRPKIGDHDFEAKTRSVKKLLQDGDKVKITIMFRGREITHANLGWKLLEKMMEVLKGTVVIEKQPQMEGSRMFIILAPMAAHNLNKPTQAPSKPVAVEKIAEKIPAKPVEKNKDEKVKESANA
ncbi:MAG TPA: translation initiation factor IF-3 [Dehalococcoidales bacterium]|nr:translation initiation factor IF-3 [Dehalococcoidales bacterium]